MAEDRQFPGKERERIARFFGALADPTRLHILQVLQPHPEGLHVGAITAATAVKQAAVSKQLGILHQHGLLFKRRDGNRIIYGIGDDIVFTLCAAVCAKVEREAASNLDLVVGRN